MQRKGIPDERIGTDGGVGGLSAACQVCTKCQDGEHPASTLKPTHAASWSDLNPWYVWVRWCTLHIAH